MTKTALELIIEVWKLPPPPIVLPANYRHTRTQVQRCLEGENKYDEATVGMFTPEADKLQDEYLDHLAECSLCQAREHATTK